MLLQRHVLDGIVAGTITLAFRRWRRPTVRAGGRLRTAVGELAIDAVDVVRVEDITAADARAAGVASRDALVTGLAARGPGDVYRIALRFAGADRRIALRERDEVDDDELARIAARLARFDAASRHGAWTRATLDLIAAHPAVRAAELAARVGREMLPFKADVRKLKELGLTESLEVGYRLSPRGCAVLTRLPTTASGTTRRR
jgi:hypothetical protein